MPHPESSITSAFALSQAMEPLQLVQHTSFETWRLRTESGNFLVKRLWGMDDPPWQPNIETAMGLEATALAQGLPIAQPVEPAEPAFGYAAKVDGFGTVRLYDWIEHRTVDERDELARWLGTVVASLHRLRPLSAVEEPEWRWWGVFPRSSWEDWISTGERREFRWAKTARAQVAFLADLSDQIRRTFASANDQVLSHGDIEPYNVLISADGPILIDWESVACESATLEIGRTALSFGGENAEQISRILQAYVDGGGVLSAVGDDLFLRSVSLQLCHIVERIGVMIAGDTSPGWMGGDDLDAKAIDEINSLAPTVDRLRQLARFCAV